VYDEFAIAMAVSGLSSLVGSPGEPGCKIGTLAFEGIITKAKKSNVPCMKRLTFGEGVFLINFMIDFFSYIFKLLALINNDTQMIYLYAPLLY
jgi:hypothetical protein